MINKYNNSISYIYYFKFRINKFTLHLCQHLKMISNKHKKKKKIGTRIVTSIKQPKVAYKVRKIIIIITTVSSVERNVISKIKSCKLHTQHYRPYYFTTLICQMPKDLSILTYCQIKLTLIISFNKLAQQIVGK